MDSADGLTRDEQRTADLVGALKRTGNLRPLVEVLRDGETGPERARDALQLLGELDLELLIQVALDTLIRDHIDDPARALQNRRVVRPQIRLRIDAKFPTVGSVRGPANVRGVQCAIAAHDSIRPTTSRPLTPTSPRGCLYPPETAEPLIDDSVSPHARRLAVGLHVETSSAADGGSTELAGDDPAVWHVEWTGASSLRGVEVTCA